MILDPLFGFFSHDLAIDLGTANTLVYVMGKGVSVREPSVVARHKKTKQVLAVGDEAKQMLGKTPEAIEAFRPLRGGVISDFDAAHAMLQHYIDQTHQHHHFSLKKPRTWFSRMPRPRVIIGIPSGVTEVERRAVWEAALESGAREAYLLEEPMASAIGMGITVQSSTGSMIVDIGGGTTEIAVISLGGIVINKSIRVAGDDMDDTIINHLRLKHSLLIGAPTAEQIKVQIGSAYPLGKEVSMVIRGRSLETGLPKSIKLTSTEIRETLSMVTNQIVDQIKELIEEVPPELVGDIIEHGIHLAGGGSLLRKLDKMIAEEIRIPVVQSKEPQTTVVRGAAKVLRDPDLLERVRVTSGLS